MSKCNNTSFMGYIVITTSIDGKLVLRNKNTYIYFKEIKVKLKQ